MEYREPVMGEEVLMRIAFYRDDDGTKIYWEVCHIDRIHGRMVGTRERPAQMTLWDYMYEDHWQLMGAAENYRIKKEKYDKLKKEGKFKVKK